MEERRLPSLLVTNLTNIAYLTGFRGSAGIALFTSREGVPWVDPRYALQAQEQARSVEVIEERTSQGGWGAAQEKQGPACWL
jgi:Xaa-Pro aminopeptidase